MSCEVTWNPEDKHASYTLSALDLTATKNADIIAMLRANSSKSEGKPYFEIYIDVYNEYIGCGIATSGHSLAQRLGYETTGWSFGRLSQKYHADSYTAIDTAPSEGAILQFAVDLDVGKVWFGKNDYYVDGGDPAAGTGATFTDIDIASNPIFPAAGSYNIGAAFSIRACSDLFTYSPPSGFVPWLAIPEAKLIGTVKEKGVAVIRTVRCFYRSTGVLFDSTVSEADGSFELDAPDNSTEMFVIAFDDAYGDQYNALIYDRVKGVIL